MYLNTNCVVVIELVNQDKQFLVVPSKYCNVFHKKEKLAELFNVGVKLNPISSLIFYTPIGKRTLFQTPDFTGSVLKKDSQEQFDAQKTQLYEGFIIQIFGKCSNIHIHVL